MSHQVSRYFPFWYTFHEIPLGTLTAFHLAPQLRNVIEVFAHLSIGT